ncbi:SET domain protein 35 [Perilla frutescens var. hirtella]|uniref:SET domain protein 35 n=1 Tax=Perilla frutescens var. hirtella TaxID=608512 RepID=A0AAD4JG46_PERFH|nr:SET domain protein 35 [Perilla frutescens var. hirtella]
MHEVAEYIGAVEIKNSGISGYGLFAMKNAESGGLMLVTRAVAVDRAIMPQDSRENAHLVIWKSFVDKVMETASKCEDVSSLISNLSSGKDEALVRVPKIAIFRPEAERHIPKEDLHGVRISDMRWRSTIEINNGVKDAVGNSVNGVKVYVEGLRRGGINGVVEMEKAIKLGRGIYGKVMKKQPLRAAEAELDACW